LFDGSGHVDKVGRACWTAVNHPEDVLVVEDGGHDAVAEASGLAAEDGLAFVSLRAVDEVDGAFVVEFALIQDRLLKWSKS